jgi:hypothetical protein
LVLRGGLGLQVVPQGKFGRSANQGESMPDHERDIFRWLGSDSRGCPYHLHPLNLNWSKQGMEHDLDLFRSVADRLQADPTYWSIILRDANWRSPLVGCVCLLLRCPAGFFSDLEFCFRAGSMVSPQIAVTAGLVYPEQAIPFFVSFLGEAEATQRPRDFVSAEQVLVRLGKQSLVPVARPSQWSRVLDSDEVTLAEEVVSQHWEFWKQQVIR